MTYALRLGAVLLLGVSSAVAAAPANIDQLAGVYRSAGGTLILAPFDGLGERTLLSVKLPSGQARILQHSGNEWWAGATLLSDRRESSYRPEGSLGALERGIRRSTKWRRLPIRQLPFTIEVEGGQLAGSLLIPPGPRKRPAMILLHGSGPLTRESFGLWPWYLAANGYAVLVYDKRGSGGSTAPAPSSMETLAADAAAAVAALRREAAVDSRRVGLFGVSQGGYVALLAAPRSKPSMVVALGSMMVSGAEQERYRVAAETAADGLAPEMQRSALDFTDAMLRSSRAGSAVRAPDPAAPWAGYVYTPDSAAEASRVWRSDWSFDIRRTLPQVSSPVLALYGVNDRSTPVAASVAALRGFLPRSTCLRTVRIAGADHSLLRSRSGGRKEVVTSPGIAPEALNTLSAWLNQPTCEQRPAARRGFLPIP